MVFDHMRAAIVAAAPDKLAAVASAMAQAYGAGGLTDAEYEQLDGLLATRRRVAPAAPVRMQTLATAWAQLMPAAAPAPEGQGTASARLGSPTEVCCTVQQTSTWAHHRTGSRPRSAESAARRRRWAAAGFLPPKLAAGFTLGEQAVLAVVGKHIAARGACTLAVGAIAALAGVSDTTVRRALRQAAMVGLLTIELRRITGFRNDTNVLRLASAEWAAWLRLRLPRSARADLGGACQIVRPTGVGSFSKGSAARFGAGGGRTAGANRTTRAALRAADA